MTTVAEFLEQTRPYYLQKKRIEYLLEKDAGLGEWFSNTYNNISNGVSMTFSVGKNVATKGLSEGIQAAADEHPELATTATTYLAKVAPEKMKQVAGQNYYGGAIPEGQNRYQYLAQKMLGGDAENNPYLKYFGEQGDSYSDQQFMYDLSEIMKSNPKVADVMMKNMMAGDMTYADMLVGMGKHYEQVDPKQAQTFYDSARKLYDQKGKLGKSFFGPSMAGGFLYSGHTGGVDSAMKAQEQSAWKKPIVQLYKDQAQQANFGQYAKAYNQNIYQPEVADKYYEQNFYGALNSPMAQGAMRYAAPWLTYGVPVAGLMSLMGNHKGWLPVLGGGLASMAYGGAVGGGYLPQNQTIDNFVSWINTPLARGAQHFNATAPVSNTLSGPLQFGGGSNTSNNFSTGNSNSLSTNMSGGGTGTSLSLGSSGSGLSTGSGPNIYTQNSD